MGLFGSEDVEGRPSTKIGRLHEAETEIHLSTGDKSGPWWYQGRIRVLETEVRTTEQVVAELHDPANRPFLKLLRAGWSDDRITKWLFSETKRIEPGWVPTKQAIDATHARVERLRLLAEHANDPHVVHFYSLDRAGKSEERILAFVDQDPIKEAPQRRYSETEKGWRRKQLVTFVGMGLIDLVFLAGMISFASAPVTTGVQAQAVSQTALSSLIYVLVAAGWGASVIALYMIMARRTLVSSWEIQPIKHLSLDTHSQAVYLQNSQHEPASDYLSRLLSYRPSTIASYAAAVAKLPTDAIGTLQEQVDAQRHEIDTAQMTGIENGAMRANLRTLGAHRAAPIIESGTSLWVVIGVVASLITVVAIAVILATGG